jgi:hypothetical protein
MTSLSIRLEARSAAYRCYRAYAIDVATDLFGAWLPDMSYGRIGTIVRRPTFPQSSAGTAPPGRMGMYCHAANRQWPSRRTKTVHGHFRERLDPD